ncbi:MAG: hypothetical protein R3E50_01735 [Halioglobus sp.]
MKKSFLPLFVSGGELTVLELYEKQASKAYFSIYSLLSDGVFKRCPGSPLLQIPNEGEKFLHQMPNRVLSKSMAHHNFAGFVIRDPLSERGFCMNAAKGCNCPS